MHEQRIQIEAFLGHFALVFHHTDESVRESHGSGMLTHQHPHTVQQEFTAILFQWKTKQNLYALEMTTHFFILVPNFLCVVHVVHINDDGKIYKC